MMTLGITQDIIKQLLQKTFKDGGGPLESTLGRPMDMLPSPATVLQSELVGIANPLAGAQILAKNEGISGFKNTGKAIIDNSPIGAMRDLTGGGGMSMIGPFGDMMKPNEDSVFSSLGKSIREVVDKPPHVENIEIVPDFDLNRTQTDRIGWLEREVGNIEKKVLKSNILKKQFQ